MPHRFTARPHRAGMSPGRIGQRGQVLVLGLLAAAAAWLMVLLVAMGGGLVQEKTKLTNVADSLAYSAAVLQARSLNFSSYLNRAMVANSVATGQGVSLSSWLAYSDQLANSGRDLQVFSNMSADFASGLSDSLLLAQSIEQTGRLDDIAAESERVIQNTLVRAQQLVLNTTLEARTRLLSDLVEASFGSPDAVKLDDSPLVDEFADFLEVRAASGNSRFAEVVFTALNTDRFSTQRNWEMSLTPSACPGYANTLRRSGSLQLLRNAQWSAQDQLVEYQWTCRPDCSLCSQTVKPWAGADHSLAVAGFPDFADLSDIRLSQADPRMRFSIRVRRPINQTQPANTVRPIGRFAAFDEVPAANDEMVAVASAEVYFSTSPNPTYGQPGTERANLFNPAWRARLTSDPAAVAAARALQGIVTP